MTTEQEAWLKLMHEDPIEPDIDICDPHHHYGVFPVVTTSLRSCLQILVEATTLSIRCL